MICKGSQEIKIIIATFLQKVTSITATSICCLKKIIDKTYTAKVNI
jgi:hypothetical protein